MSAKQLNAEDLPTEFVSHPEAKSGHHESYPYLYEAIFDISTGTRYKCAGIATKRSFEIVQARNPDREVIVLSTYVGDQFTLNPKDI
jgi:hypothetical protein